MGGETYEESHVMTTPTFYSSSGCRFYKSRSSVSCHVLGAELVDVQQQMNHVLFSPWTPLLWGFWQWHAWQCLLGSSSREVPGPKKGVMSRACANLGIIKGSTPQVHTNIQTQQMLGKKKAKGVTFWNSLYILSCKTSFLIALPFRNTDSLKIES